MGVVAYFPSLMSGLRGYVVVVANLGIALIAFIHTPLHYNCFAAPSLLPHIIHHVC